MELAPVYCLLVAFALDSWLGDPRWLPHLIVWFGQAIAQGEKWFNRGGRRLLKGALLVMVLVTATYLSSYGLLAWCRGLNAWLANGLAIVLLFYCLANRTLVEEGKAVFRILKNDGLEAGRKRLSWIVGRDTSSLSEQQVRTATLETLSENLSDGVIAPLFYYVLLGVPGAVTYKMINTLDSMIGYKSERYHLFGKFAARLDDVVNYVPARITSLLMLVVAGKPQGLHFVFQEGKKHASPNAGYPEAALAYILGCQFGGPNYYHGKLVDKPYIGSHPKVLTVQDLKMATYVNWMSSTVFIVLYSITYYVSRTIY